MYAGAPRRSCGRNGATAPRFAASSALQEGLAEEMGEFGGRTNCVTLAPVMTEVPRETVSSEQLKHLISLQCIHEQARPEYMQM